MSLADVSKQALRGCKVCRVLEEEEEEVMSVALRDEQEEVKPGASAITHEYNDSRLDDAIFHVETFKRLVVFELCASTNR